MNKTFEEQLKELESIQKQLTKEDLPLEEAISLYEKGTALAKELTKALEQAKEVLIKEA